MMVYDQITFSIDFGIFRLFFLPARPTARPGGGEGGRGKTRGASEKRASDEREVKNARSERGTSERRAGRNTQKKRGKSSKNGPRMQKHLQTT